MFCQSHFQLTPFIVQTSFLKFNLSEEARVGNRNILAVPTISQYLRRTHNIKQYHNIVTKPQHHTLSQYLSHTHNNIQYHNILAVHIISHNILAIRYCTPNLLKIIASQHHLNWQTHKKISSILHCHLKQLHWLQVKNSDACLISITKSATDTRG